MTCISCYAKDCDCPCSTCKHLVPVCEICGHDSHDGSKCHACESAILHGYPMDVEDVSGSKLFKDRDTNHFITGYRAAERSILKQRMDAI